jgi:hypothetical protein
MRGWAAEWPVPILTDKKNGMNNNTMTRHELVELVIGANLTGTRFPYPDIPQLRMDSTQDIIITGIQIYTIENMPLSPNGNIVATTAQILNSFLTLYIQGEESVRQFPLINAQNIFQALATGTTQQTFEAVKLNNLIVDWNKSYIQAAAAYGNGANFSIMLSVEYKKFPPGTWAQLTKNWPPSGM